MYRCHMGPVTLDEPASRTSLDSCSNGRIIDPFHFELLEQGLIVVHMEGSSIHFPLRKRLCSEIRCPEGAGGHG